MHLKIYFAHIIMKNNLFIVLSPLNYYLMDYIVKYEKLDKIVVMTTKYYENKIKEFFNPEKLILIDIPPHQENYKKKLLTLIRLNFINFKIKEYEKVFIPSDYNIMIQMILKKIYYQELIYVEEGGTLFYKINEKNRNKIYEKIKLILKRILGLELTSGILTSKKIKKAYVYFPDFFKKYNSNIDYIDLKNIVIEKNSNLKIDYRLKNCDGIILTQPLTEDKICQNYEEVNVLLDYLSPQKNYYLKLHPREKKEKYLKLLERKNIKLFPEEYNKIPYQILHSLIRPKSIISFFSSVLFSVDSYSDKEFKRVSLVKKLNNKSILESVEIMKRYLNDLEIY